MRTLTLEPERCLLRDPPFSAVGKGKNKREQLLSLFALLGDVERPMRSGLVLGEVCAACGDVAPKNLSGLSGSLLAYHCLSCGASIRISLVVSKSAHVILNDDPPKAQLPLKVVAKESSEKSSKSKKK